ncbi:hypothetical protein [Paracoccus onubensis]|uniref:Uncharacterized protein n=1 Tax=Paracoccus onubensis TaxID=1675788 RepID=A0A418T4B1_9RHOB|nr:hypothetical protein [Paracoccus onubensis]RJE87950.1 hypothetical protein D3P04_03250 [Paracoccus onubensis]
MAWEFDKRVSSGNLLVAAGMAVSVIWGYSQLTATAERLNEKTSDQAKAIASNEARIRSVEYTTARQDERLILILDSLRKIEAKIDREP